MPAGTTAGASQRRRHGDIERSGDHRPHLDGLRAVAVYLVVLYHAGLASFRGGFVGVDVFFVLSGYLVTELLLRDLSERGHLRWSRFYARRYRRLLPASFVALMVTAVAWTLVASAAEVADATGAFRAAFLYVANWHFVDQSADYFAADVESNPVVHFWSLAVEEQFYLAWPILLGGLHAIGRRTSRPIAWVRVAVGLGAAASVAYAAHLSTSELSRAYYGTDTRAYQLLAGALLALTPQLVTLARRRAGVAAWAASLALGAVVALAVTWSTLDPIGRGVWVTVATSVLIIGLDSSTPTALARRALALPVVAYLGRVSYGTYLWHWPVIVVLQRETSVGTAPVAIVALLASTGLAAASHHLLELPIRVSPRLDRHHPRVIAAGLAVSVVAGLVLAPGVLATKPEGSVAVDWRAAQRDNPPLPECGPATVDECTVVRGSGAHLLLVGDSNARMYLPTFTAIARAGDLTLSVAVAPLCPWQDGVFYLKGIDDCRAAKAFWYDHLVGRLQPDLVVLGERPIDDPADPVDVFTPDGRFDRDTEALARSLARASVRTIDRLTDEGLSVVVLEPIPIAAKAADPLLCLSSASDADECRYGANDHPTPIERTYRARADGTRVWSLDLDALVCPRLPTCDPVVDGLVVKRDHNHITGTFAAHLATPIGALLREQGILP